MCDNTLSEGCGDASALSASVGDEYARGATRGSIRGGISSSRAGAGVGGAGGTVRSEEHTSELQSRV